ncbi:MAG: nitroreductase family protein [Rhodospirillales bacterium]
MPIPSATKAKYRARRLRCGIQLYESVGIGREDRAAAATQMLENFRLFGAPHVALVTTEAALGFYGGVDCGLYVNSFMLAARSLGVDSIAQAGTRPPIPLSSARISAAGQSQARMRHFLRLRRRRATINQYRTERAPIAGVAQFVD